MEDLVEFLSSLVGLNEGEQVELRIKATATTGEMTPYFFKGIGKAVKFALARAEGCDVFFGVAPRPGRGTKAEVTEASAGWADLDRKANVRLSTLQKRLDLFPLPPTYVVSTGGGLHAYWRLNERCQATDIEQALKAIRLCLSSDNVTDITRIMRLPFTTNYKYKPPRPVELTKAASERVYELEDLVVASRLNAFTCQVLASGDFKKYKSRSERDFAVMAEVARRGGGLELVRLLFSIHPIGDRWDESGEDYLERTWASASGLARATVEQVVDEHRPFAAYEDCYYVGETMISTFTLEPLGILEERSEDTLVCNVHSRGFTWERVPFPRSAFTKRDALQRHLKLVSWQWLGTDDHVRTLLVQLVDDLLQEEDVPKLQATSVIGRHGPQWVTPYRTLSIDPGASAISFVEVNREHPDVDCLVEEDDTTYREFLASLVGLLLQCNRAEVVHPSVAWFFATPQKERIEALVNARFPILELVGTRGSGKTSLIQDVFQPLLGYVVPRSYDCATTKFSMLALLGSTNGVPINFKEFRSHSRDGTHVQRMIRMAYDVGYDVRGRPDQTTIDYPLTAPIVLDGEDFVTDPASMERMIAVNLQPETIVPGSEAFEAFQGILTLPLGSFTGRYIQFCLEHGDKFLRGWGQFVDRAQSMVRPLVLPSRVANNYAVLFYGLRLWQAFLDRFELRWPGDTSFFKESLAYVYNLATGRTALAIDVLLSSVLNNVAVRGGREFAWRYEEEGETLWFHLTSAHEWWQADCRRRGEEALGLRALKQQLAERRGEFVGDPKTRNVGRQAFWMYPIDVKAASQALDTPYPLVVKQYILTGGTADG
jgi:hypothetical protein